MQGHTRTHPGRLWAQAFTGGCNIQANPAQPLRAGAFQDGCITCAPIPSSLWAKAFQVGYITWTNPPRHLWAGAFHGGFNKRRAATAKHRIRPRIPRRRQAPAASPPDSLQTIPYRFMTCHCRKQSCPAHGLLRRPRRGSSLARGFPTPRASPDDSPPAPTPRPRGPSARQGPADARHGTERPAPTPAEGTHRRQPSAHHLKKKNTYYSFE